jgi:hypothetical protein
MLLALGLAACAAAHGETLEDRAQIAAVADGATTLAALAMGAVETNPLGLATVVLKAPLLAYIKTLPDDERAHGYAMQSAIWSAAAANNLCVIAAIASGGAFAPACLLVGGAWGYRDWSMSAEEREFWEICRGWRVTRPEMTCTYRRNPPNDGVVEARAEATATISAAPLAK